MYFIIYSKFFAIYIFYIYFLLSEVIKIKPIKQIIKNQKVKGKFTLKSYKVISKNYSIKDLSSVLYVYLNILLNLIRSRVLFAIIFQNLSFIIISKSK